jgi:Bacterial Ig domain
VDTGVLCENRNAQDTCESATFANVLVDCNNGACVNAKFTNGTALVCSQTVASTSVSSTSTVTCQSASTDQSTVTCASGACTDMDFVTSAVNCDYDACTNAVFLHCSCCDGSGCSYSTNMPSCAASSALEFCSTRFVGQSCKAWGNPICTNVAVDETTNSSRAKLSACSNGDCQQAVFTNAAVLCDNRNFFGTSGTTCQALSATSSIVVCEEGACSQAKFVDSTVSCQATRSAPSCPSSTMTRSIVTCLDTSCASANFVASAVTCDDSYSCADATFDSCSCCDGYGCSYQVPSCQAVNGIPSDSDVSPAVSFCTMCAGQGHPLCEQGSSNSGSSPKPPPAPLPAPVPQDEPASPPTSPVADPPTAMVVPGPVVLPTLTSPTMDTNSPKPPPAPLPAPVPQDEPASSPTSPVADPPTAMVVPGPVVLPTLTSPTMDTNLVTSSNTPLVIPAIADANQTMSIADWPLHGSIAVKDDGTITYTPDTGFNGSDRFNVEICNADGRCETVAMSLTIQPASSSGG